MHRTLRIVSVSVGLVALGAVAGAAVSLLWFALQVLEVGMSVGTFARVGQALVEPTILAHLLSRGALLGALVVPPVAWALLRRVRLDRAVLGVAAGALIGGFGGQLLLGALFWGEPMPVRFAGLWCALVGVVSAAFVLRHRLSAAGAPDADVLAANEALQLTRAPGEGSVPAGRGVGRSGAAARRARS
jgi:hypothetical protein